MTEQDIKEMRRKLDDQYKKDRETLDRMLELVKRDKSGGDSVSVQEIAESQKTILERIESLVSGIDGNFTRKELKALIKERDPNFHSELKDQALSTALWKLKNAGTIKVVIAKRGRGAAIYAKA